MQDSKPTSGFLAVRNELEAKYGLKFQTNHSRVKEKNLVIKVKKNFTEEELEKNNKENSDNKNSDENLIVMKPSQLLIKNQKESEIEDKDYRCNLKQGTQSYNKSKDKRLIDDLENYEEELNSNENAFMEPLI